MIRTIETYFLIFITLSVAGWLIEVVCKYIEFRRFINRGFLIGPYCPIYGVGGVAVMLTMERYSDSPLLVFIMAMVICGSLEYAIGYAMEKLFHARWWDYSARRFNLNGRVCLETLVSFGLMSVICIYVINPFLLDVYSAIPDTPLHLLSTSLLIILISDIAVSARILSRIRTALDLTHADSTETLTRAVRRELSSKSMLIRRTLRAFPYARLRNNEQLVRLKEKQRMLKADIQRIRDSIRSGMS